MSENTKAILLNKTLLADLFGSFTVGEAIKVKENIEDCIQFLKTPSDRLMKILEDEGLTIEDFNVASGSGITEPRSPRSPRKPRVLISTNQKFVVENDELILVKGRQAEKFENVIVYNDLTDAQKKEADELVYSDNLSRGAIEPEVA